MSDEQRGPGPGGDGPYRPYGAPRYGDAGPAWGTTATLDPPTYSAPTSVGRRRRGPGMSAVVTAALLAGLVGGGTGFAGAFALLDGDRAAATAPALGSVPSTGGAAPAADGTVAAAAAIASPSTVDIRVPVGQGAAEGSGVILTADGAVLTNNHVVAGAAGPITVTLGDGSEHTATVVGTSPSYDLAVLRMADVSGLPAATLGRSADLQVGQPVVAIGSPQGLTGTVTTGIVSALNRTVGVQGDDGQAVVYNGLQTDAPINQGNSGGPLVNLQGEVVGINSAIATLGSTGNQTGSIGLGFSIPIDQAKEIARELVDTGTATHAQLGVSVQDARDGGAAVAVVEPGSAAERIGLREGDVITHVGSRQVEDADSLIAAIRSYRPEAAVPITFTRDGSSRKATATLGSDAVSS